MMSKSQRDKFLQACKDFMEKDGLEELRELAKNKEHKDQFKSLELIAGYAFGKPKQGLELTGEEGNAIRIKLEGALEDYCK